MELVWTRSKKSSRSDQFLLYFHNFKVILQKIGTLVHKTSLFLQTWLFHTASNQRFRAFRNRNYDFWNKNLVFYCISLWKITFLILKIFSIWPFFKSKNSLNMREIATTFSRLQCLLRQAIKLKSSNTPGQNWENMELAKSATKITKTGTILIKKQNSGSATIL